MAGKNAGSGSGCPPKKDSVTMSFADKKTGKIPANALVFHGAQRARDGYLSNFKVKKFDDDSGHTFRSGEHYYQYAKAIAFKDIDIAKQIYETTNVIAAKDFGRDVKNFDQEKWNTIHRAVQKNGMYFRFRNDDGARDALIATGNCLIVEGREDRLWGTGLSEKQTKSTPIAKWNGPNLMGECLMEVRDFFAAGGGDATKREEAKAERERLLSIQVERDANVLKNREEAGFSDPKHMFEDGMEVEEDVVAYGEAMIYDQLVWQPKQFDVENWEKIETPDNKGRAVGVSGIWALVKSIKSQHPTHPMSAVTFQQVHDILKKDKTAGKGHYSGLNIGNALDKLCSSQDFDALKLVAVQFDKRAKEWYAQREGAKDNDIGHNVYIMCAPSVGKTLGNWCGLTRKIRENESGDPSEVDEAERVDGEGSANAKGNEEAEGHEEAEGNEEAEENDEAEENEEAEGNEDAEGN